MASLLLMLGVVLVGIWLGIQMIRGRIGSSDSLSFGESSKARWTRCSRCRARLDAALRLKGHRPSTLFS